MLRRSRRKRVSTRTRRALWLLNISVLCVLLLLCFRLFMWICLCVYLIVYACAGALRTSLLLQLIGNFSAFALSGPVHCIHFQSKTELFCSVVKKICVHTYRFSIIFVRRILQRRSREKPHGSVCPLFWILTVEWSGARSCLF